MKKILPLLILFSILMFVGNFVYNLFITGGGGKLTYEKAASKLEKLVDGIDWSEKYVQRRAKVQLGQSKDLAKSLPDVSLYKTVVDPPRGGDAVIVEIFASTEKSGQGIDGVMVEMANDFNAGNIRLGNGKPARVRIRKIASGTGYQYIASGKYRPDAFSPSNHLWVRMSEAHGVKMTPVSEKIVGNLAGIVMKDAVAERLKSTYGDLNVKNLIDAVVQGKLVMGYTNPFASSTGLNFLVTILATFAGDSSDTMLSPEVVSSLVSFQKGVPFIALTTLQMRESVMNDGSLEAFVMEYQTFVNTSVLQSGYRFIPFGVRHDNPLYAVGELPPEKQEVLERFAAFAKNDKYLKVSKKYGFFPDIEYRPAFDIPAGDVLVRAQRIWKEKKDAGRPITAIFLCDVSGSMRGDRLNRLKKALMGGSEFIGAHNSIGILLFDNDVTAVLPVKPFDLPHKAAFHAAVEDMFADGKTAMYDGIAVSLHFLLREKEMNPDIKPLLFVLTDGETNVGLTYTKISPVIEGLGIPVYTIGYEANIDELKRLSSLVEAASLNAGEDEIEYKIGALLNAQM